MGIEGLHSLFSPSSEPLTNCAFTSSQRCGDVLFVASPILSASRRVCAVLLANRLIAGAPIPLSYRTLLASTEISKEKHESCVVWRVLPDLQMAGTPDERPTQPGSEREIIPANPLPEKSCHLFPILPHR